MVHGEMPISRPEMVVKRGLHTMDAEIVHKQRTWIVAVRTRWIRLGPQGQHQFISNLFDQQALGHRSRGYTPMQGQVVFSPFVASLVARSDRLVTVPPGNSVIYGKASSRQYVAGHRTGQLCSRITPKGMLGSGHTIPSSRTKKKPIT